MKLADAKAAVKQWSDAEKIHLAAYLRHLGRRDDPAYRVQLDREWESISTGASITLHDFHRIHEAVDEIRITRCERADE